MSETEESVHMHQLKTARSDLKKKIVLSGNRVRSAIERRSPEKNIIDSWGELEIAYSDFEEVNSIYSATINGQKELGEKYAVVNNLGLEEYEKSVYELYDAARSSVHHYQLNLMKSEFAEISDKVDVIIKKFVTEKDAYKLEVLLGRSKALISQISLLKSTKGSYLGEQWSTLADDMTKKIQQLEDAEDDAQVKLKRLSIKGSHNNHEDVHFQPSSSLPNQYTQFNGSLPSNSSQTMTCCFFCTRGSDSN